jgi:uncharacterized membrane protein YccC
MNEIIQKHLREWRDGSRRTFTSMRDELANMSLRGARARESLKAALSVVLAIAMARMLGLDDLWWVAFSGFMVIRASFDETLRRGTYRIAGTIVGAILALGITAVMLDHPLLLAIWVFVFSAATLYLSMASRYGYAWLFMGVTHVMVLAFAVITPDSLMGIARLRIADVAIGTLACFIVGALFDLGGARSASFGKAWRGLAGTPVVWPTGSPDRSLRRRLVLHAGEAALAMTCAAAFGYLFKMATFTQAAVTVFAVMMIPIADFATNRRGAVRRKLIHRCLGCLLGGFTGIVMLLLTGHVPVLWWLALAVGAWVGKHLQDGDPAIGYIGTQFSVGYLTAFVHDAHLSDSYNAAFIRLAGILTGLAFLATILFIGALLSTPKQIAD